MNEKQLIKIIEAVLFAADGPMSLNQLLALFDENSGVDKNTLVLALESIKQDCHTRSIELREVASGYRFQVKQDYADWVSKLWEDKPAKYSKATMETLSLIAYRQPITRAEIEEVRGVSVSSHIIKSMTERNWVKVVGHRDVPGKPALYATTKEFLDYFNLKSLEDLPSLAEIRDIDTINAELNLGLMDETLKPEEEENPAESASDEANENQVEENQAEENTDESAADDTEENQDLADVPVDSGTQDPNEEVITEAISVEQ
jgi:segregation and condensation protein B